MTSDHCNLNTSIKVLSYQIEAFSKLVELMPLDDSMSRLLGIISMAQLRALDDVQESASNLSLSNSESWGPANDSIGH